MYEKIIRKGILVNSLAKSLFKKNQDEFEDDTLEIPDDFDSMEPMQDDPPPKKIKLEAEEPKNDEPHPDFDDDDFADIDFDEDMLENEVVPKKEIKIVSKFPHYFHNINYAF